MRASSVIPGARRARGARRAPTRPRPCAPAPRTRPRGRGPRRRRSPRRSRRARTAITEPGAPDPSDPGRRQDLQPPAVAQGVGAGARRERADPAQHRGGRLVPSDPAVVGGELGRGGGVRRVLGHRDGRAGGEGRDRVREERAAELGEAGAERAGVLVLADGGRHLLEDRAGVEALVHQHRGDAGLGVAGQQRVLDGPRAAPSRQQGQVQVHGAERRRVEDLAREELAVRDDGEDVRARLEQAFAALALAHGRRPRRAGGPRARAAVATGVGSGPAPRRPGRGVAREHQHDLEVRVVGERGERRHRPRRVPQVHDARGHALTPRRRAAVSGAARGPSRSAAAR